MSATVDHVVVLALENRSFRTTSGSAMRGAMKSTSRTVPSSVSNSVSRIRVSPR
jgi:hypothetical protein